MTESDSPKLLNAAPVSAAALIGAAASPGKPRELSRAALAAAAEPTRPAYSPIVVAGFVRLIDCALIFVSGLVVYAAYLLPAISFNWDYAIAIFGVAGLSVFVFQAADVYQIHAFQRPVTHLPRLLSAWSVVFLIATTVSFFAKLDVTLSRVWLVSFYALGFVALFAWRIGLYRLVHRWMHEGRLTRRTVIVGGGEAGEKLVAAIDREEDKDVQIVGIFDDRNDERAQFHPRLSKAWHRRRFYTVRAAHTDRSRDLLAADFRRDAHPADA